MEVGYRSLDFLGYPHYRVGTDGSVWSDWRGHWTRLRPAPDADGYRMVSLRAAGRKRAWFKVHALVLRSFVGEPPLGHVCRHFPDPNRSNNSLANLSWGTKAANQADRIAHGTDDRGQKSPLAKLRDADVPEIHAAYRAGESTSQIARRYGVHQGSIRRVLCGERYAHVRTEFRAEIRKPKERSSGAKNPSARLTEDDVRQARLELSGGSTIASVARKLGVSESTVSRIKNGRGWKSLV